MRTWRVVVCAAAAAMLLVLGAGPAAAHGGSTPGVIAVAQTLGTRELTVSMAVPAAGTGTLRLTITEQGAAPGAAVRARLVPTADPGWARGEVSVPTTPTPTTPAARPAPTTWDLDHPGPWELVLADGPDVARLPLLVPEVPPTPTWVWLVRVGLAATVVGGIAASTQLARRPRLSAALGAVAVAGVTVVVVAAVLSTDLPAPAPVAADVATPSSPLVGSPPGPAGMAGMAGMGGMGGMAGMSMGSAAAAAGHGSGAIVLATSTRPSAGGTLELALGLTDGSTGDPVDDLVVHDDALIHLAVIDPAGHLWHVHPVRTEPGRYAVRLPLTDTGRYGVFAEMERADGGHQVARSAFDLDQAPPTSVAAASSTAGTAPNGPPGPRQVADMTVNASVAAPVAGRTSRLELSFSAGGRPVADLQRWLGMAGHLLVLGPARPGSAAPDPLDPATSFAHVHDMSTPAVPGYGSRVAFSYAFPTPGRYQVWVQVQRHERLVTVPLLVDVTGGLGRAGV